MALDDNLVYRTGHAGLALIRTLYRHDFPELDEPGTREYFLSFAFALIEGVSQPSDSFEDSQWNAALENMGLNNATQDLIMLEEFSDIRQTESAVFWAKDTVDIRLGGLEELKRASWERSQHSDRRRQRAGREERTDVRSVVPGMSVGTANEAIGNKLVIVTYLKRKSDLRITTQ